jgi:hypothetical protein
LLTRKVKLLVRVSGPIPPKFRYRLELPGLYSLKYLLAHDNQRWVRGQLSSVGDTLYTIKQEEKIARRRC